MSPSWLVHHIRDYLIRLRYRKSAGDVSDHTRLGRLGEDLAVAELKKMGYRIIGRNQKVSGREMDVIATDGDLLVFVEVKTRSSDSHGAPEMAVNKKRQDRMKTAARIYLESKKLRNTSVRFDVVSVDFSHHERGEIRVTKNAFY